MAAVATWRLLPVRVIAAQVVPHLFRQAQPCLVKVALWCWPVAMVAQAAICSCRATSNTQRMHHYLRAVRQAHQAVTFGLQLVAVVISQCWLACQQHESVAPWRCRAARVQQHQAVVCRSPRRPVARAVRVAPCPSAQVLRLRARVAICCSRVALLRVGKVVPWLWVLALVQAALAARFR